MSYDISLYDRDFLVHALSTGLGDWTGAPSIPVSAKDALVSYAVSTGFEPTQQDPKFIEFLRAQGVEPSRDFLLDTATHLAQMHIHSGEISFAVPYGGRAEASISLCAELAKRIAREFALGYNDPQSGDDIFQ